MNDSLGFAQDSLTILIDLLALQHVTNFEANFRESADPNKTDYSHDPDPGRVRALADLAGSWRILVWFRSAPGPDWPSLHSFMTFAFPWLGLHGLVWLGLT